MEDTAWASDKYLDDPRVEAAEKTRPLSEFANYESWVDPEHEFELLNAITLT